MGNQKTILILGGGYYNLPLIKKSVELGYYTIVCGIEGNYPGYACASLWEDINIFDKEQVLEVAKKHHVNAILATGADTIMPVIGYVNDQLHLIGPSEQCTILSTNKYEMKKRFFEYGVRTATYQMVRSIDEAMIFAQAHSFSVVLKVVDKCGGVGIAIVQSKEELIRDFDIVFAQTKLDYIIIEEYVRGIEFGAQAYVKNGRITFVMPHGDMVHHGLTDVPVGHYAPYEMSAEQIEDVHRQLALCIGALEIDNAAINADFILSDGKVYVLEIGARAGATCLPELVTECYNKNYYEYMLRSVMGEEVDETFEPQNAAIVETLISTKSGIVKDIRIGAMPREVINYEIYPRINDEVSAFRTAYDRIGMMIIRGERLDSLWKVREHVHENCLNIEILEKD